MSRALASSSASAYVSDLALAIASSTNVAARSARA